MNKKQNFNFIEFHCITLIWLGYTLSEEDVIMCDNLKSYIIFSIAMFSDYRNGKLNSLWNGQEDTTKKSICVFSIIYKIGEREEELEREGTAAAAAANAARSNKMRTKKERKK